MQILTGTVSKVQYSTRTTGSKEGGTSTSHVALFELGVAPVTLSLPDVIAISEGDVVSVAGYEKRGLFHGLAYCNKSNKVKGKSSVIVNFALGAVFCFSVVGAPVGLWLLYCGYRNQRAFAAIDLPCNEVGEGPSA